MIDIYIVWGFLSRKYAY